jgi:hypothetical protein
MWRTVGIVSVVAAVVSVTAVALMATALSGGRAFVSGTAVVFAWVLGTSLSIVAGIIAAISGSKLKDSKTYRLGFAGLAVGALEFVALAWLFLLFMSSD